MAHLWEMGQTRTERQPLSGDTETEVLIIGGGITGILCARRLYEAGIPHLVVEADEIGGGITKGTTATLTAQHDTLYLDIAKRYGDAAAGAYLSANLDAVKRLGELAAGIDCDWEVCPSVMYSRTGRDRLSEEAAYLNRLGFPAVYTNDPGLPFPVRDAVVYPDMAQFHPLKFLLAVSRDLPVVTHTRVLRLDGHTAVTDRGNIRAKQIIVATHFPFINRRGLYFLKLYQNRSYVIVYRNAPHFGCFAEGAEEGGFYFRDYKNLLLIGGGDHRTGRRGGGYDAVRELAARLFPQAEEVDRWSNQDCITLDGIPYIGAYSPAMPGVHVATGFGLWGFTTACAAADILAASVRGETHPHAAVFNPARTLLHPTLAVNAAAAIGGLLFPTTRRCPHLGCALHYNRAEHSWDCACHGSRFDEGGRLIDNPANRNANI